MRRRHDEQEFGSDSFLDIVANVVGILIILIVVAGVRVSRMPVRSSADIDPALAPELVAATVAPAPPVMALPTPPPPLPAAEKPPQVIAPPPLPPKPRVVIVKNPLPALPSPALPAKLVQQAESLREKISESELEQRTLAAGLAETKTRETELAARITELRQREDAARLRMEQERAGAAAGERELDELRAQLQRLRENLSELEVEPAPTTIQHRVTPIGRTVHGEELHYHLAAGRVAHVPVQELARRLKLQIERQKDVFLKQERYEGAIDPIDGFRMRYVIERQGLSLADELKYGQHVIRMQVSQWTLVPEPDVVSESVEQAVQRGSLFYQSILTAGPSATMTFWVYPDSFDACIRLKEFAHRHGYEVAARPLPFGVLITGSPDGSKSVAQ